jgi:hypothetical protein
MKQFRPAKRFLARLLERYTPSFHTYLLHVRMLMRLRQLFPVKPAPKAPRALFMEDRDAGFFSIFFQVLGAVEYCKRHRLNLTLSFNIGPYFDASFGGNWWSYYFDRSEFWFAPEGDGHRTVPVDFTGQNVFSRYGEYMPTVRGSKVIPDLLLKPEITERVSLFVGAKFSGRSVTGVHYRGTDKVTGDVAESIRVPYGYVVNYLREHFNGSTHFFVATDEERFLKEMQSQFAGRIICYDSVRSANNIPPHGREAMNSGQRIGEDALMDCLILSRCRSLVRTDSNLSRACSFFNPSLPVVNITERYKRERRAFEAARDL